MRPVRPQQRNGTSPFRRLIGRSPLLGWIARRHWALRIAAGLIPLLVVAALGYGVWSLYDRISAGGDRRQLVDVGVRDNAPTRDSDYCRRMFGYGASYPGCLADERNGYRLYAHAWSLGRDLGTVRDQLVGCYLEGRRMEGMSWAAAAHCAEADMIDPEANQTN